MFGKHGDLILVQDVQMRVILRRRINIKEHQDVLYIEQTTEPQKTIRFRRQCISGTHQSICQRKQLASG